MSRKSRSAKSIRLDELKLRVMAEYGSSGIWVIGETGPFRHGGMGYSSLQLSNDLEKRFGHWIELYYGRLDYPEFQHIDFNVTEFNQFGRSLACDLKAHIGVAGYVEFIPELEEGGLGQAEIIPQKLALTRCRRVVGGFRHAQSAFSNWQGQNDLLEIILLHPWLARNRISNLRFYVCHCA